jgi:chromosome partitioning protein
MKVVSVINYKGGVGKTSITANIAAELAFRGKNVLLLDLDPQASLTFSFITTESWGKQFAESRTIKKWFDCLSKGESLDISRLAFKPKRVNDAVNGSVSLIASHLGLINVDLELATELSGTTLKQAKRNYLRVHRRLLQGLRTIPANTYDIILIDCPPNFNIVTKNAIVASDCVLVPAKPDYLSTLGIDYLMESLRQLVQDYNDFAGVDDGEAIERISPKVLGVVFTMVQFNRKQPISALRPIIAQTKKLNVPVFDSLVRENKTVFAEAPLTGLPVVLQAYSSDTHQRVVKELRELVTEFERRLS